MDHRHLTEEEAAEFCTNRLSANRRGQVLSHLRECKNCEDWVVDTMTAIGSIPEEEVGRRIQNLRREVLGEDDDDQT